MDDNNMDNLSCGPYYILENFENDEDSMDDLGNIEVQI